jgi:hypothetical protein
MGQGILMILANVGPEDEREFNRWYDREHMRERVEIPGFLSARRYKSIGGAPWKYLAIYETEGLGTFRSPVYLSALANQSAWSKRTFAKFRDPQRSVAEYTWRSGYGTAAVLSLTRLRAKQGKAADLRTALSSELLPRLLENDAVIRASLMECDQLLSRPVPEYPPSSIDLIRPDDWFVTVDAVAPEEARFHLPDAIGNHLLDTSQAIGTFALLWDLHRSDLPPFAEANR